jgi:hypothetical protein
MPRWFKIYLFTCLVLVIAMVAVFIQPTKSVAQAAGTYITCDPYLAALPVDSKPTYFLIFLDGAITGTNSPAVTEAGGNVIMKWYIDSIPTGTHTLLAQACNDWGCSPNSEPWTFTKGTAPTKPTGLKLVLR